MHASARLASLPAAVITAATLAAAPPRPSLAQGAPPPNGGPPAPVDTAYARLVREYTSDARFLPANLATLPASAAVPSPRQHFGTVVGAPGVMHRSAEVYGYFRALSRATPRVRLEKVGTSEEGRDIMLAVIADEATMPQLARHRALAARLADPRRLSPAEADAVADSAKPVYYLNAGLHSPEMGSPEMVMELAYRLAVSEEPAIRRIRERVITLINPVSEPDGRDKQVDWYLKYTKGRPQWDDGFPRTSPYWGKYVVHDNNRDGIQLSQALTKAISRVYYDWHPLVMHDLHESVPLLYVSTGTGPYNETADPIQVSEWQLLANHDVTALSAAGLPGVWTWGFFDGWWPGYAMWVANNHNAIGRFYETFGNAGADTYVRDLSAQRYAGELVTSRQWYRAWPPTKKVRWSARDNVNYMQAGVLASLGYTADNARTLLRNFYQKGVNSLTRGRTEKPHAYVIPGFGRQRDPRRAAYLVNQLRRHGIEVHRAASGDSAGAGAGVSAGDFVVRLDQPYRDLAVNLLSKQNFPSTAQYPPYDDIAWTLGYLYGVEVKAVDDTLVLRRPGLALLADTAAAGGGVTGSGPVHLLRNHAQGEILPMLYALRRSAGSARVSAAERQFVVGRDSFPAGSLVVEGVSAGAARELSERYGLPLVAVPSAPAVPRHAVDAPRVAIYHSWFDTQDEGWARYTFEQSGVPYTSIDKDDLRRGRLRERFDVVLVPSVRGSLDDFIHEHSRKWGAIPFQRSPATPAFGAPASSPDITGGPGFEGMAELHRFVRDGGTLITLAGATRIVGETGIARELSPHATRTLFHPGSVVRAEARQPLSPILYGYPASTTIFRGNGPLYEVAARDSGAVVLQYGARKAPEPEGDAPMLGIPARARPAAARPDSAKPAAARGDSAKPAAARPDSAKPAGARADSAKGGAKAGGEYVLSGMVRGQDEIVGQGAIFDVPVAKGRVIAFTFDPLHRYLNHHEFPLVWNAIMNWNDRPAALGSAPATAAATAAAAASGEAR